MRNRILGEGIGERKGELAHGLPYQEDIPQFSSIFEVNSCHYVFCDFPSELAFVSFGSCHLDSPLLYNMISFLIKLCVGLPLSSLIN